MFKTLTYEESEHLININELKKKYHINTCSAKIKNLLLMAIKNIENEFDINLIYKIWKVQHNNHHINLKGPVIDIFSIKDSKNNDIKNVFINRNNENVMLTLPIDLGEVTVVYSTGYNNDNLPDCLKTSIEEEFFNIYYNTYACKIEIDYEKENKKIEQLTSKYYLEMKG